MSSHQKSVSGLAADAQSVPSKDMAPFPDKFFSIFFQNQFRTMIELPTKEKYPGVKAKCGIITGSNIGLGFESAKQLLALGLSHLVMGVRSLEKGKAAVSQLRTVNSSAKIEVWQLDMDSYDSIQAFVLRCQENLSHIDFVILNAGLAPLKFTTNPATGHEKTIQVNHISTVFLAILLLPVLKSMPKGHQNNPPRLTIVNSVTAHLCKFPNKSKRPLLPSFDDLAVTPFDGQERYGVSKLLCQLFIVKLAQNVNPDDVIINMVDPGLTKSTGLTRDTRGGLAMAVKIFLSIAGRPVNRGAATYVDAVLGHGKESHGSFLMNCKNAPLACWYYQKDGKVLTDVIWIETLRELSSVAGVEQIIASMQSPEQQ